VAAESFNTIFHVVERGGFSGALRVGPRERIHAEGTEIVEARWMRELRASRAVSPPTVFDNADGGPVVRASSAGVPGERVCMLFGWVRGRPLSQTMSPGAAEQMGTLAARLHERAPTGDPIEPPLVADRVLHWRLENRLHEVASSDSLISEAVDRAQHAFDQIWAHPPHPPHLLHGDLTPDNIIIDDDAAMVPIDFQDLVWGFDIQDLAITLTSFGRFDKPEALRGRFRAGYTKVRCWPALDAETLDALTAARRLHQLNLALTLRKPGLADYVARARRLIGDWMTDNPQHRRI
jgi:Ser/Thr protein kinase RdoA (MazF antagonist)